MDKKNVLIVDPLHPSALSFLKENFNVTYSLQPPESELKDLIKDTEIIILRSGVKLTQKILEYAKKLKIIARAGVGIDNIDISYAKDRDIIVFNVPNVSSSSVAELTFALMLGIMRKVVLADSQLRKNIWNKSELYGLELKGKTIGIIGFGKIGSYVAKIAKGFDMNILACVLHPSEERKKMLGQNQIKLTDLKTLLKNSDIISLHVPFINETKNLISEKEFGIMKKTAILINLARGGVVNESDLYNALKNKTIFGAATDVFEKEKQQSPLFELENIVVSPHIGAMTFESQEQIGKILVENIMKILEGKPIENQVC